jgi:hypothetical protein
MLSSRILTITLISISHFTAEETKVFSKDKTLAMVTELRKNGAWHGGSHS